MRRNVRIRNRALIILLLPIALALWMTGWVLYWKGSHGHDQGSKTPVENNGIEISAGLLEESIEHVD